MVGERGKDQAREGEDLRFPEERAAVAKIQAAHHFEGDDAVEWAIKERLFQPGDVVVAEVCPTLRCPEDCPGCDSSLSRVKEEIEQGLLLKRENRAAPEQVAQRIRYLQSLGVEHLMFIGGTIDYLPELPDLIKLSQEQEMRVSWFTDCIPLIDEVSGLPTPFLEKHLVNGWIKNVSTHVSVDYPFEADFLAEVVALPPKRGRSTLGDVDPEFSRRFKSTYGVIGMRRLIEAGVKRVVGNMTLAAANVDQLVPVYDQISALAAYGQSIGSPTEVHFTFSPWIWRPHQARGDNPQFNPASKGLQAKDMSRLNQGMQLILADTYHRLSLGRPRILANSSGFTWLHTGEDPEMQRIIVEQDTGYPRGRPEMFNVTPAGDLWLDPMFPGPELAVIKNLFGYRDREPRLERNPFTQFSDPDHSVFSNLIAI